MAKSIVSTDSTFTPGEAEKITGVSTALQRDWRRREIIPANGNGWTQHSAQDLARLLFLQTIARLGRDPSENVHHADTASLRILYYALKCPGAVENNTDDPEIANHEWVGWTGGGGPHRFVVIDVRGRAAFVNELHWPFDQEEPIFAARILDLQALGAFIALRAGRPLISVNYEDETEASRAAYAERLKKMPMLDRKARKARGDAERENWAEAMKPKTDEDRRARFAEQKAKTEDRARRKRLEDQKAKLARAVAKDKKK